jgi:hypothetical protein
MVWASFRLYTGSEYQADKNKTMSSFLKKYFCKHDDIEYKDSWFIDGKIVTVITTICKKCERIKEQRS